VLNHATNNDGLTEPGKSEITHTTPTANQQSQDLQITNPPITSKESTEAPKSQTDPKEIPKEDPKKGVGKDPKNKTSPETNVEPVQKEKTVSKSIRLWESAFAALKVLMGKYGMNMVDMVSTAIIAYAEKAAAAPILRYRIMDRKTLFPLQASATDIRAGLSKLGDDLNNARKSHRDPEERKAIYTSISTKHLATMAHADETLTLMDKECLLHDLLTPSEHALLVQLLDRLEHAKPKNRSERQIRDLHLKIYKTLLP
jgi:hypothetical protein